MNNPNINQRNSKSLFLPTLIVISLTVFVVFLLKTFKREPEVKEYEKIAVPLQGYRIIKTNKTWNIASQGIVKPKISPKITTEVSGKVIFISNKFYDGGSFIKGDTLLKIDPTDHEANLANAKLLLQKAKVKLAVELASKEQAEEEWKNRNTVPPSELALKIPQLKEAKENLTYAEKNVSKFQKYLDKTIIKAPFDGMIESKMVEIGEFVNIGQKLGQIYSTNIFEVRLPITEIDMPFISWDRLLKNNGKFFIKASLFKEDGPFKKEWQASIYRMEGQLDPTLKIPYLLAEIKNPFLNKIPLLPNTFLEAKLEGSTRENILKIPKISVYDNKLVLQIDLKENKLFSKKIKLIRIEDEFAYIEETNSIKEGDLISITPLEKYIDGMKIIVQNEDKLKK